MTTTIARMAVSILLAGGWFIGDADAETPSGAFSLQSYEMQGDEQDDVAGLLIMHDGRFGMIYTMAIDGARSGRAHAGEYVVRQDRLVFDVKWWVEDVGGEARAVSPERVVATIDMNGEELSLTFESGSIQKWRSVDGGEPAGKAGVWRLERALPAGAPQASSGLFLLADDRFAFHYEVNQAGEVDAYAYGGAVSGTASKPSGQLELTTRYSISFEDGEGSVETPESAGTAVFPDFARSVLSLAGEGSFELQRQGNAAESSEIGRPK